MKKFTSLFSTVLAALLLIPTVLHAASIRPTLTFLDATDSVVSRVEATLGETFTAPYLTSDVREILRSVTYTSTNETVATVDALGNVTLVAAGTTMILANFLGDDTYYAARASYTLEVKEKTTPQPEPTCPMARYNLSSADNVLYLEVGDVVSIPELLGGAGSILRLSAKTIDSILVAELTEDDQIHAVGVGTATFTGLYIHANAATGTTLNCEYSFTISVSSAAPQKPSPEIAFDAQEVNIELGETFVAPKIVNPNNIEFTARNSKWYTNWNSEVASVDEATGAVTILGVGTETIYFEFTGNDVYSGAIISFTIHVTSSGLVVAGIPVTSKNAGDILGDNGSITYDPVTHTLTMTNAVISGEPVVISGMPSRARQEEQIEAGILYSDKNPLTVVVVGANAINNVDACILSQHAAVLMRGEDNGSIRMVGATVGLKAPALKVYQCLVTAYGGSAGLAAQTLSVAKGSNIVADGQLLAIQAQEFVKAEDGDGEGIDILTAGVTFVPNQGFMKDGTYATHVEIGKVVVVPTTTEVTTIDFTQTDPDGDETVIFSASATDTYNEATGQLEIATTLTEAQVETAMETLVPGSSEWMAFLPGSLIFDIPAGEGEVKIQCMTVPGFSLQVKVEGKAAVSVTQVSLGWAKVAYNIAAPLHVVIYLQSSNPSSSPARIATSAKDDDPTTVGAYIQAVKIAPKDAPDPNPTTGVEDVQSEEVQRDNVQSTKVIKDGQLLIERNGRIYDAQGKEID